MKKETVVNATATIAGLAASAAAAYTLGTACRLIPVAGKFDAIVVKVGAAAMGGAVGKFVGDMTTASVYDLADGFLDLDESALKRK